MSNKVKITIGIPAYNEEANIRFLLRELLVQKSDGFVLDKIIVNSDGSSDKTCEEVIKVKSKNVHLIRNMRRLGRAVRQNQIIRKTDMDILVLLDADIQINDKYFLYKLINPILKGQADLTSALVEELPPVNIIDMVLHSSMKFKKTLFESINNGDNIYTCHGRARAFSKQLYKKLNFKESVGEDAFSYLYCKYNGYIYKYVNNTKIYYKLPTSYSDHEKQSIRFYKTQELLKNKFGEKFVNNSYHLPKFKILKALFITSMKEPVLIGYAILAIYLKMKSLIVEQAENVWNISASSKNLRI